MTALLLLLAALLVAGALWWRRSPWPASRREQVWQRRLLLLTRGDAGAIERGVTARRRKFPRATRAELLEMLHDDYLRDRR